MTDDFIDDLVDQMTDEEVLALIALCVRRGIFTLVNDEIVYRPMTIQ